MADEEGVTLTTEGFDEFQAKLEKLKSSVRGPLRDESLRAGAAIVYGAIQDAAPRGKTGRLKSDLKWQQKGNTITVFYNESWPWEALFLEKGTKQNRDWRGEKITSAQARKNRKRILNIGSSEWHVDPEKHAFMVKAFLSVEHSALTIMANTLRAGIESAANA